MLALLAIGFHAPTWPTYAPVLRYLGARPCWHVRTFVGHVGHVSTHFQSLAKYTYGFTLYPLLHIIYIHFFKI